MKKWIKYLIGAIVFGGVFTLLEYLFSKSLNWRLIIVTTIIYAVLNTLVELISMKIEEKGKVKTSKEKNKKKVEKR